MMIIIGDPLLKGDEVDFVEILDGSKTKLTDLK